jgi:hypothetical protein
MLADQPLPLRATAQAAAPLDSAPS